MRLDESKQITRLMGRDSAPGFPIRVDNDLAHLFIDSNRAIWWTSKTTGVTTKMGPWLGDASMWGLYETPWPGYGKRLRRRTQ